jgi:hypothetical protein
VTELLGSDVVLIAAALSGLALTSVGILRDRGPIRWPLKPGVEIDAEPVVTSNA